MKDGTIAGVVVSRRRSPDIPIRREGEGKGLTGRSLCLGLLFESPRADIGLGLFGRAGDEGVVRAVRGGEVAERAVRGRRDCALRVREEAVRDVVPDEAADGARRIAVVVEAVQHEEVLARVVQHQQHAEVGVVAPFHVDYWSSGKVPRRRRQGELPDLREVHGLWRLPARAG